MQAISSSQGLEFNAPSGLFRIRVNGAHSGLEVETPGGVVPITGAGGGGGASYSVSAFQREHNAATAVQTALTILDWDTPQYADAGFGYASGVVTIGPELDGKRAVFSVSVNVDTNSNNRSELVVELQRDTGSGFARVQSGGCYATRNNTQDKGQAVVPGWIDTLSAGAAYRVQLVRQGVACLTEPGGCFWSIRTF